MPDSDVSAVGADPGTPGREQRFRHQIEAGVSISGRIHFPGAARIDGELRGEVRADSLLVLGEAAKVEGTVSAHHMRVEGTLVGNIVDSDNVELQPTAKVLGDIQARHLVVHAGARFDGAARIGGHASPATGRNEARTPGTGAQRRRANA